MYEKESFIDDLTKLISYKSILGESKKDAPFGEEVKNALEFYLCRGKDFGFNVKNYENYVGEISYGEGEEIGIIGHLDVVPIGDGWKTDPFTLTKIRDVYYGRGLGDDKTPMLICLYALKKLKDENVKFNRKIRIFAGTNEESGWKDIDYYKSRYTFPKYGFSPDGNFPVSYAEKGIYQVTFKIPRLKNFKDIKGGTVFNAVCDKATCTGKIDEELISRHGLKVINNVIYSYGVSCHGSIPEKGKNAIKYLFEYFYSAGEDVKNVLDCLFVKDGNLDNLKNEQGKVTLSPNIIYENENGINIICDCRIPAPLTIDKITPIFDRFGMQYSVTEKHKPFMTAKDGWFTRTLLKAYKDVLGLDGKPQSQCGSTFARAFECGVAFGPEFVNEKSTIHESNECIKEESIEKLFDVYYTAIKYLVE